MATGNDSEGLLRNLNWMHSVSVIVGTMLGAGIFVVTSDAAGAMGPAVPLGFVIAVPIIVATALIYSIYMSGPLGEHPGGAYVHISRTWNSLFTGYIFMWLKWVSFIGALTTLAIGFGEAMKFFDAFQFFSVQNWAFVWLTFFFILNILGVDIFGKAQVIMTSVLVVILLLLAIPGLFFVDFSNFSPLFPDQIYSDGYITPILAGMSALMFSYIGFEALAQTAGETENPTKTLPKIFAYSTAAVGILYTLVTIVVIGTLGWQSAADTSTPLTAAAQTYFPIGTAGLIAFGSMLAYGTSLNSTFMVPSRILYAFGEDRIIPKSLQHINERFNTPDVGLTITWFFAVALIFTSTFQFTLSISLAALFLMYTAHSLSALALPWVRPGLWEKSNLKFSRGVLAIIAILSAFFMGIFAWQTLSLNTLGPALNTLARGQVIDSLTSSPVLLIIFWAVIGIAIYFGYRAYLRSQGVEFNEEQRLQRLYDRDRSSSTDD